jgi:hypothetical protein
MKCNQSLLILATLAFASCSSVNVRTEHDPRTNFAKYRTYSWAPHPKSGIQPGPGVRAQIEASLDQGLAATRARIVWIPDPAKNTNRAFGLARYRGPGWVMHHFTIDQPRPISCRVVGLTLSRCGSPCDHQSSSW